MKILTTILVAMLLCVTGMAQHTLKGKVTDLQTGEELQGATISTGKTSVNTNEKGEFEVTSDTYIDSVTVAYTGYTKQVIKISGENKYLKIQLTPSAISLNEVVVASYESNRKLLQTAGSVGLITKNELNRNNSVSLQPALNSIPGVRMDQSHSEDSRISIRGVGIRSTFGIRNLKVYINDIPLTEANGFTALKDWM